MDTFLRDSIDRRITDIREYNEREFRQLKDSINRIRSKQFELYSHINDKESKLSQSIWEIEIKIARLTYYGLYALTLIVVLLAITIALI
jgi:hypothetical protein